MSRKWTRKSYTESCGKKFKRREIKTSADCLKDELRTSSDFMDYWREWINKTNPDFDEASKNARYLSKYGLNKAKTILKHQIPAEDIDIEIASNISFSYQKITNKRELTSKEANHFLLQAKELIRWWKNNTKGSPNAIGTTRFSIPSPKHLSEEFGYYLREKYSNWKRMPCYAIKVGSKIWEDFLDYLELKHSINLKG